MKIGINQKGAPIRTCFIVHANSDVSFLKAVELAFGIWGGIFSPILPFHEELPHPYRRELQIDVSTSSFYSNTFENYDIDVIVVDDGIDKSRVQTWASQRPVLSIHEFINGDRMSHHINAIPIEKVAEAVARSEFKYIRNDNLRFHFPEIPANEIFLRIFFGTLPDKNKTSVYEPFSRYNAASSIAVDWSSTEEFLGITHLDLQALNYHRLSGWRNQVPGPTRVMYCLNVNRLQDIMNFWNLRAAGWLVIPLPVDLGYNRILRYFFDNFYQSEVSRQQGQNFNMIHCLVGDRDSEVLLEELKLLYHQENKGAQSGSLSVQRWFPRFWSEHEYSIADHIKSITPFFESKFEYYDVVDGRASFFPLPLPFEIDVDLYDRSAYKIIMELSPENNYAEYAGMMTELSPQQLRQVFDHSFMEDLRLSAGQLHYTLMAHRTEREIVVKPPKTTNFFKIYFQNKGFRVLETSNSKLAREVFKNIEGLYGVLYFLHKDRLKIIELFEESREVLYVTLLAEIKKHLNNTKHPDFFIKRMLETKMIELGAVIKCTVCEQQGYFLPKHVTPELVCPICRNSFELPMSRPKEIAWAYRGIGPFRKNNKAHGVMSVFATLHLFVNHIADNRRISSLFGFELAKTGRSENATPKEVDLCLITGDERDTYKRPDLIFCECKTYIYFKPIDMERLKALGNEFPGAILTVATLNEELSVEEKVLLSDLIKHFQSGDGPRPRNPVLILTGKELLNSQPAFPLREYEDRMHAHQRYNDFLGALCEMSVKSI